MKYEKYMIVLLTERCRFILHKRKSEQWMIPKLIKPLFFKP